MVEIFTAFKTRLIYYFSGEAEQSLNEKLKHTYKAGRPTCAVVVRFE